VLSENLDADFLDPISPLVLRMPALREIPEELPWLWDSLYGKTLERAELEQPPAALPPPPARTLCPATSACCGLTLFADRSAARREHLRRQLVQV
jgi:hypothetical protein